MALLAAELDRLLTVVLGLALVLLAAELDMLLAVLPELVPAGHVNTGGPL